MKRLPDVAIHRIVTLRRQGMGVGQIAKTLGEEGLPGHRTTVRKHISALEDGSLDTYYKHPSDIGGIKTLTTDQVEFIDKEMMRDDELSARKLQDGLHERFGVNASLTTIKRRRREKGWVKTRPRYCQMIKQVNRAKRLAYCEEAVARGETFDDVIFTDESIVELENHSRMCFRKRGDPTYQPKLKPRAKHPVKVFVWAGISKRGATRILVFKGIMDSPIYVREILEKTYREWANNKFPEGFRLYQDRDPKHTSFFTRAYLRQSGLVWLEGAPESPDLNPIENLWAELKDWLRINIKPKTQAELVDGIRQFWDTVDIAKCQKYIGHLKKVIPKVIEVKGAASGY